MTRGLSAVLPAPIDHSAPLSITAIRTVPLTGMLGKGVGSGGLRSAALGRNFDWESLPPRIDEKRALQHLKGEKRRRGRDPKRRRHDWAGLLAIPIFGSMRPLGLPEIVVINRINCSC